MPDQSVKGRLLVDGVPTERGLAGLLGGLIPGLPAVVAGRPTTIGEALAAIPVTATQFGCRGDAVIAADGTATGTDNAISLQACANWCRDTGRPMLLLPGRYLTTKTITAYTDIYAVGAQIVMPYAADATILAVENMPGDQTTIPLAEVQSWTGWRRRARRMGGLSGRRGEYIALDTGDQIQINRVGAAAIRFGEGFRVADDGDVLAHTLFGNANNAAWTSGTFVSKKIRHPITVQGLRLAFTKPLGTVSGTANCGVDNRRPNVRFVGVTVENLSGLQVAQGFVDSSVCDVTHEDGFVRGLTVVNTNYGWNSNLCAGIVYDRCRQEYCRRGIDAHRSKHICVIACELPDGLGAHCAWWMGAIGGTIGASTANNNQALNFAGGGFYCHKAQIVVTKAADTVLRVRSDVFECGDGLDLSDCNIVIDVDTVGPTLIGAQGSAAGFDYGRAVEMPRLLKCTGNTIEVRGANTVLRLVQWLLAWGATAFPGGAIVDSRWDIGGNTIVFPDGGPFLANGTPRVEIQANKPETATGSGITAVIADLPCLSLVTITPLGGRTTATRFGGRLERIDGQVSYKWVYGSYAQVLVDAGSLVESIIGGTNSTPVGGESILSAGPSMARYDVITSSGSVPVPPWARTCTITPIGAGGGGGTGRRGAAGSVRNGSGAGGAGAYNSETFLASEVGTSLTVTVGAGGAGAPAVTTDDTNGGTGSAGGASIVVNGTTGAELIRANGGQGGGGGSSAAPGTGGSGGSGVSIEAVGSGGSAGAAGALGNSGTAGIRGSGGGGAGGGLTAANVASTGRNGAGGYGITQGRDSAGGALGAVGANGTAGQAKRWPRGAAGGGGGGGAGVADGSSAGGAGGAGGLPGGGGGGGGASVNGSATGDGGVGGNGEVRILWRG